jgi:uncharacterized protein (DUF4415 family)
MISIKGKPGRTLLPKPASESDARITIRLDRDIASRLFELAEPSPGTAGCQTLVNAALREYLDGKAPKLEDTLRRVIREELGSRAA